MRRFDPVHTVMTGDPVTVRPNTPFKDVVALLAEHRVSAVPVVDDEDMPIGVVSEADLLTKEQYQDLDHRPSQFAGPRQRHDRDKAQALTAAELMSPRPMTIGPDTPIPQAARELARAGVRRLLVVDVEGD
jgi:CBS domain-containing protein